MARLYKFLHSRDLPRLLNDETIRICSASYLRREYELMEVGRRDPTINDPLEGSVHQIQGFGGGPGMRRLAARMGLRISDDSAFYYGVGCQGGLIVDQVEDFHMFCLADGPLEVLAKEFCQIHADRPGAPVYDACVEVLDEHALGSRLYGPGSMILNLQQQGLEIPLGWVLPRCALRPVQYADVEVGFDVEAPDASPFLKRAGLSWQREVRFAFDNAKQADVLEMRSTFGFPGAAPDPVMIVRVPGLSTLLRQVDIQRFL